MEAKIYYALGSSDKGEQKKIKEAFEKIGFKNPVGNFDFDKDLHVYVVIALDNLFFTTIIDSQVQKEWEKACDLMSKGTNILNVQEYVPKPFDRVLGWDADENKSRPDIFLECIKDSDLYRYRCARSSYVHVKPYKE